MNSTDKNPYASPHSNVQEERELLLANPFFRCFLPFSFGIWLTVVIALMIDSTDQPLFDYFRDRLSEFLGVALIASIAGFVSCGWVQFRLRKDFSREVRRWVAFLCGCAAPWLAVLGILGLTSLSGSLDNQTLIIAAVLFLLLIGLGECIVLLSLIAPRSKQLGKIHETMDRSTC